MTTDVLCVHGSTWVESSVGDLVALDNVTVTITAGNGQISSTTASPFGQLTPTFGIDIHSLSPQFLQPITISAEINGTQVERSVLLFPDFSTHNQQVDLILHTVNGFDPLGVWGSVTPFDKATAVAGAQITLTASTGTVMTSTTESVDGQPPSYQFDTTTLPIGTAIRVVAAYEGHFDTRSAVIGANPLQLDFVTGWYCDGDDPFPATTSGWGFPATTSGWGFPDVACFYGYVFADGQPAEGVDIYLEFGGKRYQSQTTIYPDETIARYGIAVWGAATITDTTVRISAVQGGVHASKQVDVALDVADQQRIDDLTFDEPSAFAMHTFSDDVRDLVYHNGYVWAATGGGVVRWDPTNLSFEKYTILDGLVHHDVQTIAVDPNGNLWIGTLDGISLYTISEPVPRWISFADAQTFDGQATELVFDDQYVYASGYNSISRADFSSPDNWTLFSQNRTGRITTMQLAANGDLWASRYANRLDWYDLSSDTWTTLTPTHGLLGRYAQAIVPDGAEDIWLGYGGEGLHHYQSSTGTWNVITTAHGLVYNYVYV
ncbi:MAG: two-component regulator propeller domain-containing protein, partial [Candidatus Promineifilaceae bacterium]